MKILLKKFLPMVAVIFASATLAQASTILIDFGPTTTTTDTSSRRWNNYATFTNLSFGLVDSTNAATGITLTGVVFPVLNGGTGTGGPTSGTTTGYDSSVTSDYIFNNNNVGGTATTLTLSGLSAGTYSFKVFSARNSGGTRQTDFSIAGATTSTFSINSGTALAATTVSGLTPNGSNNIVFTFGNLGFASGGFASSSYNTAQYLNSIEITYTAVPEPSTYALLGIGLISLAFLRRKKKVA